MINAIGIDLGTTNSCMAILVKGQPVVIPNSEGTRTTPSVVAFTQDGETLVGAAAKNQQVSNPRNTISSIKRFMGRQWNEVTGEMAIVPYLVEKSIGDDVRIVVNGVRYAPQQISAMILRKLKVDAEAYLGCPVTDAVITVPAYFNNAQREATKDAGKIAGFNVLRIINEPTAASLAYGLGQAHVQTVLVIDLGGGTFDVSILELDNGLFEVKATNGDNHLGGDNFDQVIVSWMVAEFKRTQGFDLVDYPSVFPRLYQTAEQAKVELSQTLISDINLPDVITSLAGTKHLSMQLTRDKLKELTDELLDHIVRPIKQALADAALTPAGIDHVVLVGGMTRMPAVVDKIKQLINKEPHQGVDPDEVVAVGAAIQAGILGGKVEGIVLLDVTPLSLGIETKGGVFTRLIARNSTIPIRKTETFTTAVDNQTSVEIHILQGESEMAAFNKTLGVFQLSGITPARRGSMEIDVSFDIDANGIIHVLAEDIATGGEHEIRVEGRTGLSLEEVNRMVLEAGTHAEVTRLLRDLADARNLAELLAGEIARSLTVRRDKIEKSYVVTIEERISALCKSMVGSDIIDLRTKTRELTEAAQILIIKSK
ncbi:MAG: molecular chaperone DnaK [Candidatus Nitrotoga sp.]|nr:molecular chaperone DnaK [Candidatus Nitrotoga sp.]